MWFTCAFFGFLAVRLVRGLERIGRRIARKVAAKKQAEAPPAPAARETAELLVDPGRRHFFKAATAAAGAAPFLGAMYGFAAERLNYQIRRVEIPIANLPPALDGMQIVQISDIHLSGYMSTAQVRRAVDMSNGLGDALTDA